MLLFSTRLMLKFSLQEVFQLWSSTYRSHPPADQWRHQTATWSRSSWQVCCVYALCSVSFLMKLPAVVHYVPSSVSTSIVCPAGWASKRTSTASFSTRRTTRWPRGHSAASVRPTASSLWDSESRTLQLGRWGSSQEHFDLDNTSVSSSAPEGVKILRWIQALMCPSWELSHRCFTREGLCLGVQENRLSARPTEDGKESHVSALICRWMQNWSIYVRINRISQELQQRIDKMHKNRLSK